MEKGWDWDLHGPLLWAGIGDTLYMVSLTLAVGGLGGLLIGIMVYVTRTGAILENRYIFGVLNVLINFVRPIPFVILLLGIAPLTLILLGTFTGATAAVVPLSIAVTFGFARIVEQNLVTVDPGVIEAARAAGASRLRTIFTVIVPEALGPLILGFTFVFVAVIDMTAIAGGFGGGGLGYVAISYGFNRWNTVVLWVCVGVIILIVHTVQLFGNWLARKALRH